MKNGDLGIFCFAEGVLVLVGGIFNLVRFLTLGEDEKERERRLRRFLSLLFLSLFKEDGHFVSFSLSLLVLGILEEGKLNFFF